MGNDHYKGDEGYYDGANCDGYECKAKLCEAKTLPECSNECTKPEGKCGPLVAKIPVVISEPRVQIDVEALIELEEPALEIKRIKKNLFITQCKLINIGFEKKGKLFLSGYVRKNIEYATAKCKSHEGRSISGDIRHSTVCAPFECVTMVDFINQPVFCKSGFVTEMEIFSDTQKTCDPCSPHIIGRDFCEQDFKHVECFTEKVFCELEEVKIIESDIRKNPLPLGGKFPNENIFKSFIEKMVIFVKIKLLQNQQVTIPGTGGYYDGKKDYKDDNACKDDDDYDDKKSYDYADKWPWLKKGKEKGKGKGKGCYDK